MSPLLPVLPGSVDGRLLQTLLHRSPDAIMLLEPLRAADGVVADFLCATANPACRDLLGSEPAELEGRRVSEALPDDLGEDLLDVLIRTLETGAAFQSEESLPGTAGPRWVHLEISALDDTGLVLTMRESTRLRAAEAQLADVRKDLESAERANNQILSTLSYEIRTPLNTVIGFADMILSEARGPIGDPYLEYVVDIGSAGRQMLDALGHLLDRGHLEGIQKAERGYRHIIELAPDLMCICRNGIIELINPAGANLLRVWPVEVLVGRPFAEFVHPDYRDIIDEGLDSLMEERIRVPMKFVRADTLEVDVEVAALAYEEEGEPPGVMLVARDITERNRASQAVLAREERLRRIMDTVVDGIIVIDQKGRIESFNAAAETIFGYAIQEAVGQSVDILLPSESRDKGSVMIDLLRAAGQRGVGLSREREARRKDGTVFPIDLAVSRLKLGRQRLYIGVVRDITERKRAEEQLRFLANHDPLTGLPNHALFRNRLEDAIDNADEVGRRVAILFIDLDKFKNINDTLGHPVGDRVLQAAGERLVACVGEKDTVARLSGDEFTIILHDASDPKVVAATARTMLDQLSQPFEIDGKFIYTSGSMGVITYPEDADNIGDLMMNVDIAAYHAKTMGRDTFQFYDERLSAAALWRLQTENGLRRALEKGEFELYFQPKVDLGTRRVMGAEVLLRWNKDGQGFVPPDQFIPIAEDVGLIIPIGEWVLRESLQQLRQWKALGLTPVPLAVNLSARQFRQSDLSRRITGFLAEAGLPGSMLELELTESALVENAAEAVEVLRELKKSGVSVAVDDFGTGYSSLSYLKRFPIDALKIDRSFIRDIPHAQDDIAIVRAIVGMAKSLELKTIAEGIEQEDQVVFLSALDCDIGQGYLFGRPVPASEFQTLLSPFGQSQRRSL